MVVGGVELERDVVSWKGIVVFEPADRRSWMALDEAFDFGSSADLAVN